MVDDFPLVPAVAAAVDGPAAAWDFIGRFSEIWQSPLTVADGYADFELAASEARLGLRLPAALRDGYRLFARRHSIMEAGGSLLAPGELYVHDDMLVFRIENREPSPQNRHASVEMALSGVAVAELDRPDPPVEIRLYHTALGETEWLPFLDTFSLAGVEMVLSQAVTADDGLCDVAELNDEARAVLETDFIRLALPEYPTAAPSTRWYAGRDALVREDAGSTLSVRGRDVEALYDARKVLPVEWQGP